MAEEIHNDILLEFNNEKGFFDIELDSAGADLQGATNLITSILIQLFTDARSNSDDPVPDSRGWAGDSLNPEGKQNIGSRLWIVENDFMTQDLLTKIENLATDALQTIIDQGIAKKITIDASFLNKVNGEIELKIDVTDPQENAQIFKYVWDQIKRDITGIL